MTVPRPRRRYVDVSFGQMHVVEAGVDVPDRPPMVLLHQTPRSWDEFAEVIPELARSTRVIAVDLPGMGGSDPPQAGASIESYANGVLETLDAMSIDRFDLLGHHTGGVVAVELAATVGARVRHLVLSSTAWVDAAARELRRSRAPIDQVEIQPDGAHLTTLWERRRSFYPPDRPDLLTRFVRDALRCDDPEVGHDAVSRYEMELRMVEIDTDVLLIGHGDDRFAFRELGPLASALRAAVGAHRVRIEVIEHGAVPLEFAADEVVRIVSEVVLAADGP